MSLSASRSSFNLRYLSNALTCDDEFKITKWHFSSRFPNKGRSVGNTKQEATQKEVKVMAAPTIRRKALRKIKLIEDTLTPGGYANLMRANVSFNTLDCMVGRSALDYFEGFDMSVMGVGSLPSQYVTMYRETESAYVVYSGPTPIAWRNTTGGWTAPEVGYASSRLNAHRELVVKAVALLRKAAEA